MNASASECTSGCESGWTLYLEQSFLSPTTAATAHRGSKLVDVRKSSGFWNKKEHGNKAESDEDQEHDEEDLSMVSDASSGPPHHFHEDESNYFNYGNNGCFYPAFKDTTLMNNNGGKRKKEQELPSFLDDTASSPAFNFSKNSDFAFMDKNQASMETTLDYSQAAGFSATHFEGRSAYQDHFANYIQPSSLSGNQLQHNQWF
ncbi:hypothetical protein P3X46_013685 [Hevea brasiliensis]|uniref:Uncharacterized protein n=1 Tax=Hevea brasiliensis TaxID=3981 RepID=A0ABQ9M864_HEVBR|nr:protein SOB FIVE-LIKE 5 [Hevea brasiliensis]KAJ9175103.1 hypothetical protein P3X46_013685 [Hevea brasiliensis]